MFTITKEFKFEAAHVLDEMPTGHPCATMHGHSYRVRIKLACAHLGLDPSGMVLDYNLLGPCKKVVDKLDHGVLNEKFPNMHPTAENLAHALWVQFNVAIKHSLAETDAWICAVGVSETRKTWAWYEAPAP